MALIQQQFTVSYKLNSGVVRVQQGGSFTTPQGEVRSYLPSVKISCTNIEQSDTIDPATGFASSVEQRVIFKIPFPTALEAGNVANEIQRMLINKETLLVEGSMSARNERTNVYEVTVHSYTSEKKAK